MKVIVIIALALLCAVYPSIANAEIIATYNPNADSYVEKNASTTNYGSNAQLRIKNFTDNFVRKTYLRYDLSTLAAGPESVSEASLSLSFFDTAAGSGGTTKNWEFEVYGLNDGDAGEGWLETGITWDNAPANNTTTGNGILGNATSLGTFSFTGRTANISFTGTGGTAVASYIRSSLSNDLLTFIVVRNTPATSGSVDTYVHGMYSKEQTGQTGPQLTVTSVPEPSTLAMLLGLAGIGLLGRFRRRRGGSA